MRSLLYGVYSSLSSSTARGELVSLGGKVDTLEVGDAAPPFRSLFRLATFFFRDAMKLAGVTPGLCSSSGLPRITARGARGVRLGGAGISITLHYLD